LSIPRPLHTPVALIGILCNFVPAPPAVAEPAALRLEDLYLSPPTATPLRTAPLAFVPETGLAASWSPQFDFPPSGAGLSSSVNALTVYNGELIAAGSPSEVTSNERVVEAYLGHGTAQRLRAAAGMA